MKSTISLVTGGAKSGKSAFAERLLASGFGRKAYVATAQVMDEEMAYRIECHRKRRPASWRTYEVPCGLPQMLEQILQETDAVLVDCLTIYFSNFLFRHEEETFEELQKLLLEEVEQILAVVEKSKGKQVIFVTNELGCGIVPMEQVSRYYRDLVGMVNQCMGQAADQVYLTVCGITTELKRNQVALPLLPEERS